MSQTNHIVELLTKYYSGTATESEAAEIECWRTEDPENERLFSDYRSLWRHAAKEEPFGSDPEGALTKVKQRLEEQPAVRQRSIMGPMRIAAGVALALAGAWLFMTLFIQDQPVHLTENRTMKGEKKEILLPDGTRAILNGSSLLRYPERFTGDTREIWFEGEAFFSVARDAERPFIIKTESSTVKVLGTAFNLRSRSAEDKIKIVVTEGKVAFSGKNEGSGSTLLTAGEQAVLEKRAGRISKTRTADENFLSWKTGKLIFKNTPLSKVANALSDHYGMQVTVKSDSLKDLKFTSVFDRLSLENALKVIELSMGVQADSSQGEIIITKTEE